MPAAWPSLGLLDPFFLFSCEPFSAPDIRLRNVSFRSASSLWVPAPHKPLAEDADDRQPQVLLRVRAVRAVLLLPPKEYRQR